MRFDDITKTLKKVYPPGAFDKMIAYESPFRSALFDPAEPPSTIAVLAQVALERMRPCGRGRWVRDEDGRIKIEPKPGQYMGDMPDVAAVWVYYESSGGGRGKELIKLSVEEENGEFVLRGRRW
jgi:hypothetical protein